jgi:ureidoglycolate lyase
MGERVISVEPLTPEGFAPFGDVVSAGLRAGASANQGTAVRFDWAARLVNERPDARPNLSVFRSIARTLPLSITLLEKHPRSTQAFLPLICGRILVIVAPTSADGTPELAGLRAFVALPGQGINYGVGVWHHPIVALDAPAELAMLAWEDGGVEDCVEFPLEGAVLLRG